MPVRFSEEFLSDTPHAMFSEEFLLTLLMLVLVRSFSYTPDASLIINISIVVLFSGEFLLHTSCWFSLVRSFSYTPRASFSEEFLLYS